MQIMFLGSNQLLLYIFYCGCYFISLLPCFPVMPIANDCSENITLILFSPRTRQEPFSLTT